MTNTTIKLFEELLVNSPSGGEQEVASIIQKTLKDIGYTHQLDAAGNVLVRLPGKNQNASQIVFAAHMDEIAMVVSSIEPNGELRATRLGGLYPWKLGEGPLDILGDRKMIRGVFSMGSTHILNASEQSISWETVRIITGLSPDQLEEIGVRPGTPMLPTIEQRSPQMFGDESDPLISAWTFDDRMGCVTLLRLLDFLKDNSITPFQDGWPYLQRPQ